MNFLQNHSKIRELLEKSRCMLKAFVVKYNKKSNTVATTEERP